MRDYEIMKHRCWCEEAEQMLKEILNRSVLLMRSRSGDACENAAQPEVRNSQTLNNIYPEKFSFLACYQLH